MSRSCLLVLMAALVALPACRPPTAPDDAVPAGTWGSAQAAITTSARGAHVELPCASGDIRQPLVVDKRGRFALDGVLVKAVGPARIEQPARFAGQIQKQTISLTITIVESGQTMGPYTVVLGAPASFGRCL